MIPADLRARRAALKLSQRELAELLGVSKSTISHWEIGKQKIPPYVALALDALARRK